MRALRSFGYNLLQGIRGVFRNSVMSTASVLVLLSCMIILGTVFLVYMSIRENLENIGDLNAISIRVSASYTDEQYEEIGGLLTDLCEESDLLDDEVIYVSSEEHLSQFLALHEGESYTGALLEDPERFALRPSYEMTFSKTASISELSALEARMGDLRLSDGTAPIDPDNDISSTIELYRNVKNVRQAVAAIGGWLLVLLGALSLFVIANTIRLGVESRKNEVMFMRLCGATKAFIRTPFIVEGIIIGLISACLALGLEYVLYTGVLAPFLQRVTSVTADGIALSSFGTYLPLLALLFAALGLVVGMLSSLISIKKYLKV